MAKGNAIKVKPIQLVNDYNTDSGRAIEAIKLLAEAYGCSTDITNIKDWTEADFSHVVSDFSQFDIKDLAKVESKGRNGLALCVSDINNYPFKVILEKTIQEINDIIHIIILRKTDKYNKIKFPNYYKK